MFQTHHLCMWSRGYSCWRSIRRATQTSTPVLTLLTSSSPSLCCLSLWEWWVVTGLGFSKILLKLQLKSFLADYNAQVVNLSQNLETWVFCRSPALDIITWITFCIHDIYRYFSLPKSLVILWLKKHFATELVMTWHMTKSWFILGGKVYCFCVYVVSFGYLCSVYIL